MRPRSSPVGCWDSDYLNDPEVESIPLNFGQFCANLVAGGKK